MEVIPAVALWGEPHSLQHAERLRVVYQARGGSQCLPAGIVLNVRRVLLVAHRKGQTIASRAIARFLSFRERGLGNEELRCFTEAGAAGRLQLEDSC